MNRPGKCVKRNRRRSGGVERHKLQRGFSYVIVLLLVVLLGWGLARAATSWSFLSQRDREAELLFVGQEFREALNRYAAASPAGAPRAPQQLEELLLDRRYPTVRRHLRKLYVDPITGSSEWGLVKLKDRIVGVYSKSDLTPLRTSGFPDALEHFAGAKTYSKWVFLADNVDLVAAKAGSTAPTTSLPAPGPAPVEPEVVATPPVSMKDDPARRCEGEALELEAQCSRQEGPLEQKRACSDKVDEFYRQCEQQRLYAGGR